MPVWEHDGGPAIVRGVLAPRNHKPDYRREDARHGDQPTKHPLDEFGLERREIGLRGEVRVEQRDLLLGQRIAPLADLSAVCNRGNLNWR